MSPLAVMGNGAIGAAVVIAAPSQVGTSPQFTSDDALDTHETQWRQLRDYLSGTYPHVD